MKALSQLIGPWQETDFQSGLILRVKNAWDKPIETLTNEELATLLRQDIGTAHILPSAQQRVKDGIDDDTEIYDGELAAIVSKMDSCRT